MTDTAATAAHYNANAHEEHERLVAYSLEYRISLHVVLGCLQKLQQSEDSSRSLDILDLGGGTGRYAVELAKRGHVVTLADISAAELERARMYASNERVNLSVVAVVDASRVAEHDIFRRGHYDIVLCQGPFYHLLYQSERETLLRDCATMCKPGGFVLSAFVTKFAHLRDIARRDPSRLGREAAFYRRYADDGVYDRVPTRTAHHVSVEDVESLFRRAFQQTSIDGRLEIERVWGCESFLGGGLSEQLNSLPIGDFEEWFKVCLLQADRPEVLGASDHLLVVARKL